MISLGVILARAGSKGLPNKCVRDLLGQPVIQYTFRHALASRKLTATVLTTDSAEAQTVGRSAGIEIIERPPALATDEAAVDDALRHAVEVWEASHDRPVDCVVILYGNIPIRAEGLIDRAVELLERSGADSVRSVSLVQKQHPDWLLRLDGDRLSQLRPNGIYRRQDLDALYYHDGAAAVVTRKALFAAGQVPENRQAFWGRDCRAIVQAAEATVDIDSPIDLYLAQAILQAQGAKDHVSVP